MRKIKLAAILPATQLAFAAALLRIADRVDIPYGTELYVPTARLICMGLNAPALLFRFLDPIMWGPRFAVLPSSLLGFDTHDLFFLIGVTVVWCVVGRALDRRGTLESALEGRSIGAVLVQLLLLALGVLLFMAGVHDLEHPASNNPNQPIRAFLTFVWSVSLVWVSGLAILRRFRPTTHSRNVT